MDFTIKYRPKKWSEVVGHEDLVRLLKSQKDWKALLFYGPPGVGKTTFARILATHINCENNDIESCNLSCKNCSAIMKGNCPDYLEVNVADKRGIDEMREVTNWLKLRPIMLKRKILVLDEVHMLTIPAQNMLLKELEEPPAGVSIILCTTNPEGLLETVRQRCLIYRLGRVAEKDLLNLFVRVAKEEELQIDALDEVFEDNLKKLIQQVNGIPRKFLKGLELLIKGGIIEEGIDEIEDMKDLVSMIDAGDIMGVRNEILKLLKKYNEEEIYKRVVGWWFARIKRGKNVKEIYKNLGLIKAISEYDKLMWGSADRFLYQMLSATIFSRSIQKGTDTEDI